MEHQWLLSALVAVRLFEDFATALSIRDFLNSGYNIASLHCVREEPDFQIICCNPNILVLNLGPYFR